jgi:enterochelin esterase-like enzyme
MIPMLLSAALGADRLQYVTIESAAEGRPMAYGVYEPPGWDHVKPLPLVVFLHGGGDDERAWDEHPIVTRRLDAAITSGRLPPFIAVVPNGERGFWRNWGDGTHRYEDWVIDEVIVDVRQRLPILADREHTHLMGISMGGVGTMYMGLDNLDVFSSLTVLSAPLLDGPSTLRFLQSGFIERFAPVDRIFADLDPDRVNADNCFTRAATELGETTLYVGAGTVDLPGILPSNRKFHDHLTTSGVEHTWRPFPGGHAWTAWSKVFPAALCRAMLLDRCAEVGPEEVVQR